MRTFNILLHQFVLLASMLATIQASTSPSASTQVALPSQGFERVLRRQGDIVKRQRHQQDNEDDDDTPDSDTPGYIVDSYGNAVDVQPVPQATTANLIQTIDVKAIQQSLTRGANAITARVPLPSLSSTDSSTTTARARNSASFTSTSTSTSSSPSDSSISSTTPSKTSSTSTLPTSRASSSSSSTSDDVVTSTVTPSSPPTNSATSTPSSVPFTNLWSAFNKNCKWFPVAVIITVIISLAILVGFVAILQCCARSTGKKGRPLLIPTAEGWAANDSHTNNAASRSSSFISEKRGGFSSNSQRPTPPSHRGSVVSTLSKEDFLPHSYDADAEPVYPILNQAYPARLPTPAPSRATTPFTPFTTSNVPQYQYAAAAPPSRRTTPSPAPLPMIYPFPATVPRLQRPESAALHHNPQYQSLSNTPSAPPRLPSFNQLPSLFRVPTLSRSMTPHQSQQQQQQQERMRHSFSVTSSSYSQLGPRPPKGASLNESMLEQHLTRLPPSISERRRWERCAT